jgi:hypothetical protein
MSKIQEPALSAGVFSNVARCHRGLENPRQPELFELSALDAKTNESSSRPPLWRRWAVGAKFVNVSKNGPTCVLRRTDGRMRETGEVDLSNGVFRLLRYKPPRGKSKLARRSVSECW